MKGRMFGILEVTGGILKLHNFGSNIISEPKGK